MPQIPGPFVMGPQLDTPSIQFKVNPVIDAQIAGAPYEAIGKMGEAISHYSNTVDGMQKDLERSNQFNDITTKVADMESALDAKMRTHYNPVTYVEEWNEGHRKIREEALSMSSQDKILHQSVSKMVTQSGIQGIAKAKDDQRKLFIDRTKASHLNLQDTLHRTIVDDSSLESAILQNESATQRNLAGGFYSFTDATKVNIEFRDSAVKRLATMEMQSDPNSFLSRLEDPTSIYHKYLDPNQVIEYMTKATTLAHTLDERQRTERTDEFKRNERLIFKAINNGEITSITDLDAVAPESYRPEMYDQFAEKIRKTLKAKQTDEEVDHTYRNNVYMEMRRPGGLKKWTEDAINADETLTSNQALWLIEKRESLVEHNRKLPDGLLSADGHLYKLIFGSTLSLDPKADQISAYTTASRELQDWAEKNPTASATELLAQAQVIGEKKMGTGKKAEAEAPPPESTVGANPYMKTVTDAKSQEEAKKKLLRDLAKDKDKFDAIGNVKPGLKSPPLHRKQEYNLWLDQILKWQPEKK